ncbi:MAG: hypothetical protein A2Y84_00690 [Candidatus Colwellbacteria bacterium RBG_13_48_8]|uniref:Glycosyltransferase 2-like domain-containing protein n=1 Tax=Candidatus Colwellbacteria bacterium RBG_13_48_8 TaxID=1797685 RepID=A0A1G1YYV4_9BACT|nr:MAG: hypothetical protein A2Y84_00690 [Candidatus Colwellbacteria bacterium RBG_13_48_8]
MKLSVVIPAHNEEKYISRCLESLKRYVVGDQRLLEIIVVDNASTDKTAEVVRRFPFAKLVYEPNKGLTWARQRGLLSAKGDLLGYLDADTEIGDGWLDRIYAHFSSRDDLVCVSGPAYYFDATPWQGRITHIYWDYIARSTYKVVGYMIMGGNFIAKKEALEKMGGFDTSIPFYGEDTNIARRLNEIGKVLFDNNLKVYSSGRRLKEEGVLKTGVVYATNYLSEAILKRPVTRSYKDIR